MSKKTWLIATGAVIASAADASRIGLDLRKGQLGFGSTAVKPVAKGRAALRRS